MKVQIREAVEKDLPAVLSLCAQLDVEDDQALSVKQARRIFARIKKRYPDCRIYVAVADGEIIGTFTLLFMDHLAHRGAPSGIVEDVVVHTKWQGKGMGKQMMHFAMDRCREKGCYKLVLSSNIKREAAHRFYQSLGFKKHGYSFVVELTRKKAAAS